MKAPKRRVTLKIEIGGDSWEDAAQSLESIALRIYMEGHITSLVSGGRSSGFTVIGLEDEHQTAEKFRKENAEFVRYLKECRS